MNENQITTLFLDVGGVLLTNGWDHRSRKLASETFGYSFQEAEERHQYIVIIFEQGELTLDQYLKEVIFYQPRDFTGIQFKSFMFKQSQPYQEMLQFFQQLKSTFNLTIVIISNESRELIDYRIKTFDLKALAEIFIVSCYLGLQKPNPKIYHIALDISQATPSEVIYVDDRLFLIQAAQQLGIRGIHHTEYQSTYQQLQTLFKDHLQRTH